MSINWPYAKKFLSGAIVAGAGLFAIGCGPAPGYEADVRSPGSDEALAADQPTAAVMAARQQQAQVEALQQQQAEVDAQGQPQQVGANGDVAIGGNAEEYSDTDPSALTEFKPALENHGTWVDDSTYGTVWVPSQTEVGTDFQPYVSNGHWAYNDTDNWVWVSDYEWGWAPFHYGRWVTLPNRGWAWIPGRTYAGAWVEWRTGGVGYDYVGWAPMAPEWYWWNGYAVGWGFGYYHPGYVYCPRGYIGRPYVGTYVVRGGAPGYAGIAAHTSPYHPANPGVGVAGHVVASPGVGGHVAGTMGVRSAGPSPGEIGMRGDQLSAPPTNNRGLTQAHAMASPATATRLGAAPPSTSRPRPSDAIAGQPAMRGAGGEHMSPSVANRMEPAARSPQVQGGGYQGGSASRSMPSNSAASTFHSQSGVSASAPHYSTMPSSPHSYSAPSHYSAPSVQRSAPSYHSAPSSPSSTHSSAPSHSVSRGSSRRR